MSTACQRGECSHNTAKVHRILERIARHDIDRDSALPYGEQLARITADALTEAQIAARRNRT